MGNHMSISSNVVTLDVVFEAAPKLRRQGDNVDLSS